MIIRLIKNIAVAREFVSEMNMWEQIVSSFVVILSESDYLQLSEICIMLDSGLEILLIQNYLFWTGTKKGSTNNFPNILKVIKMV